MKCIQCNHNLAIYGQHCWECRDRILSDLQDHRSWRVLMIHEKEYLLARLGGNYRELICTYEVVNKKMKYKNKNEQRRKQHHATT